MAIDVQFVWGIAAAIGLIELSALVSEISASKHLLVKLEERGRDIEYKLHCLQQTIDGIAGSVDGVEQNTRS